MTESNCNVSALVIGCGSRGDVYASYALLHPNRLSIVGIADPKAHLRNKFLQKYNKTLKKENLFSDWRDIFKNHKEKIADCAIIALPDKLHKEAAMACLDAGYHILLEKPMATSLEDCREIALKCEKNPNLINAVCHVLRYYDACQKLKEVIDSGLIGNIVNINHTEPVGFWHFAHSFVRGNWRNKSESSFSLLAKCCHDIDLLIYWMGKNKKCVSVTSFGSLVHFKKENSPSNSSNNCFDCPAEQECPYSAKKLYASENANPNTWPWSVVLDTDAVKLANLSLKVEDIEDILQNGDIKQKLDLLKKSLSHENTNYGRCVYKCDNDVCDNQVVIMNFNDGSTATLTMIAFSGDVCTRKTKIYGTKGELEWNDAKGSTITHFDFLTRKTQLIDGKSISNTEKPISNDLIKLSGHGGSDFILINSFVNAILHKDKSYILTDVDESFRSHLIVFAAELSRVKNKIVHINNDLTLNF